MSLEDEISSYLPDHKMENSSGEKPKRDNEEYYEEIEALGRFSNWCFLDGAREFSPISANFSQSEGRLEISIWNR